MAFKLITCITIRNLEIGPFVFKNHVCSIETEEEFDKFKELFVGLPEHLLSMMIVADDQADLAKRLADAQSEIAALRRESLGDSAKELNKAGTAVTSIPSAVKQAVDGPATTRQAGGLITSANPQQAVVGKD